MDVLQCFPIGRFAIRRHLRRLISIGLLVILGGGYVGCQKPISPAALEAQLADASAGDESPSETGRAAETQQAAADETETNPEQGDDMTPPPFPDARPAPPLSGGLAWINTAGPIDLEELRGKFVVLDFWTYCCINCIHVLPELKKLERAYPNEVVVIGVHSAKFEGEEDSQNIREAVLRYEIEHPVVNDANHVIWNRYGAQSWPSIRIVDPEGKLVAGASGEVEFEVLDRFLKSVLPYYRQRELLDETPLHFDLEAFRAAATPLRFPGKVLADEAGRRLFIADSNHNRIVVTRFDGELLSIIGSGAAGSADGGYGEAQFDHPQGMAIIDQTLYVADTENHLIRKVNLTGETVTTIAGVGRQGRGWFEDLSGENWTGKPLETALNSPWDLLPAGDYLYIAMAGPHQIWRMKLDESEVGLYAGNGREDIVDGPLLPDEPYALGVSSFAQPSGLASDGEQIFVADSEGSSIRAVPLDASREVSTIVGTAHLPHARLFTFGDVDGEGRDVRLQHVLGVAFHGGMLYAADTYNNKIKRVDPAKQTATTIAGAAEPGRTDDPPRFDEPAGLSAADGKLFVADTNNHLIRVVDLQDEYRVSTLEIPGLAPPKPPAAEAKRSFPNARRIEVQPAAVQPVDGAVQLEVSLQLPEGYKLNPLAPMGYLIEVEGDDGPVERAELGEYHKLAEPTAAFTIPLPVKADSGEEQVTVSLTYYYCRDEAGGVCKVASAVWSIPLQLVKKSDAMSISLQAAPE